MARRYTVEEVHDLLQRSQVILDGYAQVSAAVVGYENELKELVSRERAARHKEILGHVNVIEEAEGGYAVVEYASPLTLADVFERGDDGSAYIYSAVHGATVGQCVQRAYEESLINLDELPDFARETACLAYKREEASKIDPALSENEGALRDLADKVTEYAQLAKNPLRLLFVPKAKKGQYDEACEAFEEAVAAGEDRARNDIACLSCLHDIAERQAWDWFKENRRKVVELIDALCPNSLGEMPVVGPSENAVSSYRVASDLVHDFEAKTSRNELYYRRQAKQAIKPLKEAALQSKLKTYLVDWLDRPRRTVVKQALRDAGYVTVADVLRASSFELQLVDGVGEATAETLVKSARAKADKLRDTVEISLDESWRTKSSTDLLGALFGLKRICPVVANVRDYSGVKARAKRMMKSARIATDSLAWLFASGKERNAAIEACYNLRDFLDDDREVLLLRQYLQEIDDLDRPNGFADRIWKDFVTDRSGYQELLDSLLAEEGASKVGNAVPHVKQSVEYAQKSVPIPPVNLGGGSSRPSEARKKATKAAASSTSENRARATAKAVPEQVSAKDVLVRNNFGQHRHMGHSLVNVTAEVVIAPFSGRDPYIQQFSAQWCPQCEKYFVQEREYERLRRLGLICCQIVDGESKKSGFRNIMGGMDLAPESVAHSYGYSVSQDRGLTRDQRQLILSFLVENDIQTTQQLVELLDWLIRSRSKMRNQAHAISCWKEDKQFLVNYHPPVRTIRVSRIFARR